IVVLHDFNLHYLIADVTIGRDDWEGYFRELEYNAGSSALQHAGRIRSGEIPPDYDGVAMNRRLLEISQAAIVHSQYTRKMVRQAGFGLPVARIPHGVDPPAADLTRAGANRARARLGLDHQALIGAFGFLKPYKRIYSVLHALARMRSSFPDAQ